MRHVLLSVFALLFINFAAHAGVVRGVLLNDGLVESTRNFALGYLMIIDTAWPSLSNRVGKVPDSAQHSPDSFV
jgi:hypothetical protein